MNKHVAWYIFSVAAVWCVSLYGIREAYKKGLKDGKEIGRLDGIAETLRTINDKWLVLRETGNRDPFMWLAAVLKATEEISGISEKKEEKVDPDDEAKKEFMKAAAEAQERLMTS